MHKALKTFVKAHVMCPRHDIQGENIIQMMVDINKSC